MARYLHFAHLLHGTFQVQTGKVYEKGTLIARVGKSGTSIAHCHFEVRKDLFGGYNYYPVWKTTWFVKDHYENPLEYLARPGIGKPMVYDHLGYNFLSWVGNAFHPGIDMNRGAGNSDLGDPIYLPERAKCIAALPDFSPDSNSYGDHLYFEPVAQSVIDEEIKQMFKEIWKKEPATGDWMYFKVRKQLGNMPNMQSTMSYWYGIVYPGGQFSPKGNLRWQAEKDKYLWVK